MKFYHIHGHVEGGIYAHFTTTKIEAEKHVRELSKTCLVEVSIDKEEIKPTAKDVVGFMNDFLWMTCFNEGG